ncbi:MAG: glutamate 5-kinase [Actinomycetota bacterium]|nr:glutamate 5-kinase [Actinomycetota bacterium]
MREVTQRDTTDGQLREAPGTGPDEQERPDGQERPDEQEQPDGRAVLGTARRLVVKVGSSSLTVRGKGLDHERLDALVDVLAARQAAGTQVVLVSSGAIAAGMTPLGLRRRPRDLSTQQAAASVGQGILMARYTQAFARHGLQVGQVLLTTEDLVRRTTYANARRTLWRLLGLGVLPIVNENDTVANDEIRFGDNDRLAALVAQLVQAEVLVLLSDVDALYDGPPNRPGAARVPLITGPDDLQDIQLGSAGAAGVGLGGMVTKVDAARIASVSGIPTVLTSTDLAGQALEGKDVGTWFRAADRRPAGRLLWLAHATRPAGRLVLDEGAVAAVVERRMSLLPAGVIRVEGRFSAGDPVDLVDESGRSVARGLVSYGSSELPPLLGRSTRVLAKRLGAEYQREVMHRDDLVLLRHRSIAKRTRNT